MSQTFPQVIDCPQASELPTECVPVHSLEYMETAWRTAEAARVAAVAALQESRLELLDAEYRLRTQDKVIEDLHVRLAQLEDRLRA